MDRKILIGVSAGILLFGGVAWSIFGSSGHDSEVEAGAPIVQVSVPELTGQAKQGEGVFNQHCAECHGKNAAGQEGAAPPLVHIIYEPNHHSDRSFFLAVERGVRGHHWRFGDMPPIDGVSESEVGQIISYVRTLQRVNGIN